MAFLILRRFFIFFAPSVQGFLAHLIFKLSFEDDNNFFNFCYIYSFLGYHFEVVHLVVYFISKYTLHCGSFFCCVIFVLFQPFKPQFQETASVSLSNFCIKLAHDHCYFMLFFKFWAYLIYRLLFILSFQVILHFYLQK